MGETIGRDFGLWDVYSSWFGIATEFGSEEALPTLVRHTSLLDIVDPYEVLRGLLAHHNANGLAYVLERGVMPDTHLLPELLELALEKSNAQAISMLLPLMQKDASHLEELELEEPDEETIKDHWEYVTRPDGSIEITGYLGLGANVRIPSHLDGKPVTALSSRAFWPEEHLPRRNQVARHALRSVRVPDTLREIDMHEPRDPWRGEKGPFELTQLEELVLDEGMPVIPPYLCKECVQPTSISFPPSVRSIEEGAFFNTGLEELEIPSTVREVGTRAFAGCWSLRRVRVEQGTSFGASVFDNCRMLTSLVLPKEIRTIPAGLLHDTGITDLSFLPDTVETIENAAFSESALRSVVLPSSLRLVGQDAFQGCEKLTSVTFQS